MTDTDWKALYEQEMAAREQAERERDEWSRRFQESANIVSDAAVAQERAEADNAELLLALRSIVFVGVEGFAEHQAHESAGRVADRKHPGLALLERHRKEVAEAETRGYARAIDGVSKFLWSDKVRDFLGGYAPVDKDLNRMVRWLDRRIRAMEDGQEVGGQSPDERRDMAIARMLEEVRRDPGEPVLRDLAEDDVTETSRETRGETRRMCTCTGTCRGADGLAAGWTCALAK